LLGGKIMRGRRSARPAAAAAIIAVLVACSGNAAKPQPGSVLCGANGSNQCPHGQQCDASLGCVECTTNADCSQANPVCITGIGSCAECLQNGACPAAPPACWPGDAACHRACNTNDACPPEASICDASSGVGVCVGCRTSNDCGGPLRICDTTTKQCVQCA